ncbi:MAG: type III-B CRISPR-associated protein Cas10/Cmr2 [Trueperaceae bacterium]|nr:type III-B CRISPR-associated protein Cas10/Cmr2 [Trueperaceae bacterium]
MSAHLILVALGPVQDFISQARRTRDLWYGSHLLSELSRAAARALVAGEARLIFPALAAGDPELTECFAPLRDDGKPPHNVANKLLAEVPEHVDPEQLAVATRDAVARFWREDLAGPVKVKCAGLIAEGIEAVWNEQIGSFLEFAATWLPVGEYAATRRRLEQVLSGRKALRDFDVWTESRGGVPKSSLDGARETVLLPPKGARAASGRGYRADQLVRRYRIGTGEQLDAVGLVKRAGGDPDQFVPVVNVALASWLDRASQCAPRELANLGEACERAGIARVKRADLPCAARFGFDASVLFPSRWAPVLDEQLLDIDAGAWGRQHVNPLLSKMREPYPYVVCLVADGDRMGRAIDGLGEPDAHREFSRALSSFAGRAREIVEQRHLGALVYAGGDDVLAFLPLPEAIGCAEALRRAFVESMTSAGALLSPELRPTLSVGLGVGHVLEGMGDLLALGRTAEHIAKRERDSLAVVVDKRSGGTRTWTAPWGAEPSRSLADAVTLLEDRLPSRKVYEVAALYRRLPEPGAVTGGGWSRVLASEVTRVLARVEGGAVRPEEVGLSLDEGESYAGLRGRVESWVARMLIARTFDKAAVTGPRVRGEAA